ncbi:SRPBCC family protein [Corynebacterium sphenisci]|uniref:SRPBCC family protein n=1 Tax=Corynebacterium sphenisci TaxID=191493 RepID=UPI0026E02DD2|nr:SRPBCC family protein [Corynebacterium sphenisci]MDO5730644.1 SRPBCC family protein [Corynebacterium sphenisci]
MTQQSTDEFPDIVVERRIDASPEAVWRAISDLRAMGERSPQCRRMLILGGAPKVGTRTVNINHRGLFHWPTTARITAWEPNRRLAFRVTENRTVWSYELEPAEGGTRVIERRSRDATTWISELMVRLFLGGPETFERELRAGMAETLDHVARRAEAGA